MKKTARAWAPGNISCIFKICEDKDPLKKGSLGLGFTIDKGVTVEVSKSEETEIIFNDENILFPTIVSVIHAITKENIFVRISSDLPLGGGFGVSGASALATAYALNELLDLRKETIELAKIAHVAEVENMTGLGDVTNQYFGGFLLKTQPSSEFVVQRIPLENIPVYCKFFSRLSTKNILSDEKMREKLDTAADEALEKVHMLLKDKKDIQFKDLLVISKEFVEKSRLLKDQQVMKTVEEIESRGGNASMILLGNSVMSDTMFTSASSYSITNNSATILS